MGRLNCAFLRALDENAAPVNGGKLYVYAAGTSTPATTYADASLTTPQSPHGLAANAAGEFATAYAAPGTYKVVVKDAADVTLYETDYVVVPGSASTLAIAPEDFGAVGDGTTDDSTALAAFFAALPGNVGLFDSGATYVATQKLSIPGGSFTLNANGATIDFSGIDNGDGDATGALIACYGAATTPVNISTIVETTNANSTVSVTVTTSAAHGFAAGDEVLLYSDDVVDVGHDATNETRGQWVRIATVPTSTTFTTLQGLAETLPTNPKAMKPTWVGGAEINDLRIVGPGRRPTAAGYAGLSFFYARDCVVTNYHATNVDYHALVQDNCLRVDFLGAKLFFEPQGGSTAVQYGVALKNACSDGVARDIVCYGSKHAVDWTRNTNPGIGRNFRIEKVTAYKTWDAAVAMHGNARDCVLDGVITHNCLYGVNIRAAGWRVYNVHGEDCVDVLRLTQDARDIRARGITGERVSYGIRATDASGASPWIGVYESRNIRIDDWSFVTVGNNAVHLDWSGIPTYTQADAACTGGSTTSITMGDFPDAQYNNSGALTGSELTFDPDGGGSAVTVSRVVTHTYSGGVNTLTWATAVGTAPQAGVCTYVLRSYVDDVEIGDGFSRNCVNADVYIKGPIRRMKIGRYSAISDTVQAAACLLIQADANEKIHSLTLGGIKYLNKAVPSGMSNVRSLNYEDQIAVTDYGAAGDDETDSTTAFQQAHDFANALFAARGGAVHVPSGAYRLNSVSWHPNVSWTGDGRRTTQITSINNATGHMFHLLARTNGSEQDKNPYPLFAGMTLFGNKANQVGTYSGIYAEPQVNDPSYRIKLTLTGSITVVTGETLTQATSGATGVVQTGGTGTTFHLTSPTGTFNTSNQLTGSTSGALGASSVPTAVDTDVDDYRAARLNDVVSSKFTGDGIQFLGGRSAPYLEAVRALNNDGCGVVMNGANDPVIGNRCGFGSNGSYGIQIKSLSGMLMNGVNAWGTADRTVVSGSVHIRNVTAGAVVGCTFNDKILINSSVSGDFVPIAITGNTFRTNSTTLNAGDTDAFIVIDDVKGVNISGNTAVRHPSTGQWDYFVKMVGTAAATLDYRGVSVADTANCCFDTALVNDDSKCHYTASYTDTGVFASSDSYYIGNTYLSKSQAVVRRTSNGVAASFQQDSFGSPNFLIDLYSSGRTDLTFGGDGWLELPDASTLYTKFGSTTVLTHTKTSFKIDAALSGTGILGTVSQSGGVPTGALFEHAATHERRSSGWQGEQKTDLSVVNVSTALGSVFRSGDITWNFGKAFATGELPVLSVNAAHSDVIGFRVTALSETSVTFQLIAAVSITATVPVRARATGRWSNMT